MIVGLANLESDGVPSQRDIRVDLPPMIAKTLTRLLRIGSESIREAAATILKGGLVVYPTDTVYGLGCHPFDKEAVNKVLDVKRRSKGNFPVLVGSIEKAKELGEVDGNAETLALRFWPGPLTIVVSSSAEFPPPIVGTGRMVGLRIPGRTDTLDLISMCGGSLVGTSANISGAPSITRAEEALKTFDGKVELVLDGGSLSKRPESTVVRVTGKHVDILREGAISRQEIVMALRTKVEHRD
ncbi:threonylcarbamoyl-AMP synthase [Candidatus Bathyarchaeota archaeon]|nr:MAG: threonylcarbamoyl-AMP synthase [Candidatus Bathyarchaeota archaeon]